MRGALLPAAMLCVAVGLMLAFAPRRIVIGAVLLLVVTAAALSLISLDPIATEPAFLGCWASIILITLMCHLPRGVPDWLAMAAAIDAGFWIAALVQAQGNAGDLPRALPAVLILLPAIWIRRQGWQIAIKVAGSWLIAIALLAALLPTSATTPGYMPDHMD